MYGDPMLTASLLQAAAGMSYGYPPLPQMPMMASSMQQAATAAAAAAAAAGPTPTHYSYAAAYRYAPYGIPQRNVVDHQSQAGYALGIPNHGYPQLNVPMGKTESLQTPASPLSTLSLSPTGSEKLASPLKSNSADIHNGLLMTAPQPPTTVPSSEQQYQHHHHHQQHHHSGQTIIPKNEKPKLFKPYNSE